MKKYIFNKFGILLTVLLINIRVSCFIVSNYDNEFSYFLFNANEKYTSKEIVIIALDDKTINSEKFKRFQDINRSDYATLLRNILYANPKTIGIDINFINKSDNKFQDKELSEILKSNDNIIIGTEYIFDSAKQEYKTLETFMGKEFANLGYVDITSKKLFDTKIFEGKNNKYNTIIIHSGDILPLSFKVYQKNFDIKSTKIEENAMLFDNKKIPLKKDFTFNINFFSDKYQTLSFIDVLENNFDPNELTNKIILIGATAGDIHDTFFTPYRPYDLIPGVVIHANALNALISSKYIKYLNLFEFIILVCVFSLLLSLILYKIKDIKKGFALSFVVLLLFLGIAIGSFFAFNIIFEIYPIIISFVITNLLMYIFKFIEEKRSKDYIKNIFSKYVSKDVVNQLIKEGSENLGLLGETKKITVFFSDLVGFTSISEDLTPQNLGKILNIYLEIMSKIILQKGGTIDKFMGDAIMAFWNAPLEIANHENLACETALLQRKALIEVKNQLNLFGSNAQIDMRIGINTGEVVVGNFGSNMRYDYTVLGDNVNLGSRLEGINKQYGTKIIISENTFANIDKDKFITRELDLITVKGKTHPIKIYELIGFREDVDDSTLEKIERFHDAFKLYKTQNFKEAKSIFEQIKDAPSDVFALRCQNFIDNPPDTNRDGVFRFNVK